MEEQQSMAEKSRPTGRGKPHSIDSRREVVRLSKAGLKQSNIAKRLKIPDNTISIWMQRYHDETLLPEQVNYKKKKAETPVPKTVVAPVKHELVGKKFIYEEEFAELKRENFALKEQIKKLKPFAQLYLDSIN